MTWRTFISAIKNSNLIDSPLYKILNDLFNAAGCVKEFDESTAKSWIYGSRNCKTNKYFPEGKLNDVQAAFYFLRKRQESKLKKLQQIFREINDTNSPINLETDDMDKFCWSLLNQFLDLLGLQRLNIPSEKPPDSESTDNNQTINRQLPASQNIIANQKFLICDNNERIISQENLQNKNIGAQLSIPSECKICLFCQSWKGNARDNHNMFSDVYGICLVYNKKTLSTEGVMCNKFTPNYGRITTYEHHKLYQNTLQGKKIY